jgi:hypothetical protein
MTTTPLARLHPRAAHRQRGVVLFVALIAMVVLSLAGVALIRSVDTTGSVAGNLAFRQASVAPLNLAMEQAVDALFLSKTIANPTVDLPAQRYFASLQAGEKLNGVPDVLAGQYPPASYPVVFGYDIDPATNAEVRSVIERVCNAPGLPTIAICDELPPKVSVAKTSMKLTGPTIPPIPIYRVTVRVDFPGTNTVSFAQAMLK